VSQLASANAAAIAADAKRARTKGRRFNCKLPQLLGFPKPPPVDGCPEKSHRTR
jgi:hypothetical protein